jgi:hypothetical protein
MPNPVQGQGVANSILRGEQDLRVGPKVTGALSVLSGSREGLVYSGRL